MCQVNDLKSKIFLILEPADASGVCGRAVDIFLITLIAVNVVAVVLETVNSLFIRYETAFYFLELFSVSVFTLEYIARVWVCVDCEEFKGQKRTRLQYVLSPLALIDLCAILPFYLSFFIVFDLRFLRALRLFRVFKLTRYSSAMSMLMDVLKEESKTFFAGFFLLMVLLILSASGTYIVEHEAQPEVFASIPHAMWWAIITLTSVGYGDVIPITPAGQFFGSLVSVIGVVVVALPAGILASGFADHARTNRNEMHKQLKNALEDGIIDANEEEELEALRKKLGISQRTLDQVYAEVEAKTHEENEFICCHCGKSQKPLRE